MEDLTFGEQVKIILGRKGMTIKELAEIIEQRTGKKMSRQNLTQRLGRDNFQEQDMRMIADILGCPFHLNILTSEVQEASASVVQSILADRAQKVQKTEKQSHKKQSARKNHTVETTVNDAVKDTTESEPYQMSLFDDAVIIGKTDVEEPIYEAKSDAAEEMSVVEEPIFEAEPTVTEVAAYESEQTVTEEALYEPEQAAAEEYAVDLTEAEEEPYEPVQAVSEESAYEPEVTYEEPEAYTESAPYEETAYTESASYEDAATYTEPATYEAPESYTEPGTYTAEQPADTSGIPEEAEEVDMTIGELYQIHEGLTELEKSVEAGEPVESIKEELEKPVEQIKPKKERFRTGGIFLRKRGINLSPLRSLSKEEPAREEAAKAEPVREEPEREEEVREETVRTSFTETVPVREEPRRTVPTPDSDDFEPVIQYDDVEEDLELGEINPYTGHEFQSNSVRMHPNRIGYVQVYDRSSHKWTDMTEWAFLGYQERKKALLGKDYEPPIYLD